MPNPDTISQKNYHTLSIVEHNGFYTLTLNRPEVKNAMNQEMVRELTDFFTQVKMAQARAVFIKGKGSVFCAGADIKELSVLREQSQERGKENQTPHSVLWQMNRAIGALLMQIQSASTVVVCGVHGAALGGGFGLMCAADIVISTRCAQMGMPETKLGLSPAQIAPFVLQRISLSQAKQLALVGKLISGEQAHAMGLADRCVESEEQLLNAWDKLAHDIAQCAPQANAQTKSLLHNSYLGPSETLLDSAANHFESALTSEEGQAGTTAFHKKTKAPWVPESN